MEINWTDFHLKKANTFPKTKYELFVNSDTIYSFVTTSRDEDECLNLMIEKMDNAIYTNDVWYKVYSIREKKKKLLLKGSLKKKLHTFTKLNKKLDE